MATMVIGDKTLLDEETKRLYQTAGLSHIMAISGLHISVIGMTLYHFLRKRGLPFGVSGLCAGVLLYGYGTMVGMGVSVQRAVGMFVLLLLAQTIGRSYDSLNALGLMALVLLWKNPYLLWDAGFQFSFCGNPRRCVAWRVRVVWGRSAREEKADAVCQSDRTACDTAACGVALF